MTDRERAVWAAIIDEPQPPGFRLVHTATILRLGWEMDNKLWVIEAPDGFFSASTHHGRIQMPPYESLDDLIKQHEAALASLRRAKALMT